MEKLFIDSVNAPSLNETVRVNCDHMVYIMKSTLITLILNLLFL